MAGGLGVTITENYPYIGQKWAHPTPYLESFKNLQIWGGGLSIISLE